ncbi:MAG: 1-acyl-sn-glycerol-3-phosphate acyltransferase [Hellea sp.]
MAKFNNPHVTANTPRMGNAVTRGLGALILKVLGWKVRGQLADTKKAVLIGAPHSSILDFFLAMGSMLSVGLKFSWMMKKEAFFFPFKGLFIKLGGVPIDRSSRNDVVAQMADWFDTKDIAWLGLTPEGTRRKVSAFKRGYLRIAYAANIPVFLVVVDGKNKEVVLDRVWPLTGDIERDNSDIKAYYDNYVGVKPKKS